MEIRFWGTRGSTPTPGPTTVRYGGNTSCIEVRTAAGTVIVLDCGTGGRPLGAALVAEAAAAGTVPCGSILIGHTHWDHIHGLPFFAPLFTPGARWALYGPRGLGRSLGDTLAGQMEYAYFPVSLDDVAAEVTYHDLVEGSFQIDDVTVRTHYLNHPALTLGYRLEADGRTVVYATDHEPHDRSLALGGDVLASPQDARHVAFLEGADVLIHDTQYLAREYAQRAGWGHSTVEYVVDVAALAGVGRLVLHHHDPARSDDAVDEVVALARARAAAAGGTALIEAAAEGAVIHLEPREARSGPRSGHPSAVQVPAEGDVASTVVLAVDDPAPATTIRAAAASEGLHLVEDDGQRGGGPPGVPTVVVADVGAGAGGPHGRRWTPGEGVSVLGLTRHLPAPADLIGVTDWLVWPCSVAHVRTKLRAVALRTACRWTAAPATADESGRLAALYSLDLLDTAAEERFDRHTELACRALDVPIALVTLVDADRQWFKSKQGTDVVETPRDQSLCAHAILGDDVFAVPDLLLDVRFADSPAVRGPERIRSYAGVPLSLPDGSKVGTLCVADHRPRLLDHDQLVELRRIAALVEAELRA